jgi:methyl-accepting chemotaxis protein
MASGEQAFLTLIASVARVEELLDRATVLLSTAEKAAANVQAVTNRADGVAEAAGRAVQAADRTTAVVKANVEEIQALTAQSALIIEGFAEPLAKLQPTIERLADTLNSTKLDALVSLIDRLPSLAEAMIDDLMPLLHRLDKIAPDLHQTLEGVSDINRVLSKVPGLNLPHRDSAAEQT